jgi:Calcineurin-like phosphoesterase
MNAWWLLASVATATVAWYVRSQRTLSPQQKTMRTTDDYAVYVIGDLHGDVECARQWVERTGLVVVQDANGKMTWVGDATAKTSHLVFMGDYIDKGITSKQTVEYVKSLTDQFPSTVTALMGNHELELLRDRTHRIWGDNKAGYFQLPYSSAHPAEYLNYLDATSAADRRVDEMVIEALYNASLEVYARGLYRSTFITPDLDHAGSILHLIEDTELRHVVRERLVVYQEAYLNAYRTGTRLGTWLEQRPVAAMIHGTLFVHGGISLPVARFVKTSDNITRLNALLAEHAIESKLQTFLQQHLHGRTVYDMLTYRGNHKDTACDWLPQVLPDHTTRLALGHTPSGTVRIRNCRGGSDAASSTSSSSKNDLQILALDSALSRWFRNSGNDYCLGNHVNVSSDGQYECGRKSNRCQGQIVRIANDRVQVLELQ